MRLSFKFSSNFKKWELNFRQKVIVLFLSQFRGLLHRTASRCWRSASLAGLVAAWLVLSALLAVSVILEPYCNLQGNVSYISSHSNNESSSNIISLAIILKFLPCGHKRTVTVKKSIFVIARIMQRNDFFRLKYLCY